MISRDSQSIMRSYKKYKEIPATLYGDWVLLFSGFRLSFLLFLVHVRSVQTALPFHALPSLLEKQASRHQKYVEGAVHQVRIFAHFRFIKKAAEV